MSPLELPIPPMRYDITMPLLDGRVEIEGVTLKPTPITAMIGRDEPELREGRFGLCDLNLGYVLPAIEAGWELIALPIFSKRKPAHQYVFCRVDAEIRKPTDLHGKRIGTRAYRTALTIWARGLLQERHGVDLTKLHWVATAREVFPVHDVGAHVELLQTQKTPVQMLFDGDVEAIITDISDPQLFHTLETSPEITRLFPNYVTLDERLYQETGIFTPVHAMVMSKTLNAEHPDLAPRIYDAFERAKQLAFEDILGDRAGFSVVYLRERLKEQIERWGDPWKYGLEANRSTIDAFVRYNADQGMIRRPLAYEEIFPRATLDT